MHEWDARAHGKGSRGRGEEGARSCARRSRRQAGGFSGHRACVGLDRSRRSRRGRLEAEGELTRGGIVVDFFYEFLINEYFIYIK